MIRAKRKKIKDRMKAPPFPRGAEPEPPLTRAYSLLQQTLCALWRQYSAYRFTSNRREGPSHIYEVPVFKNGCVLVGGERNGACLK